MKQWVKNLNRDVFLEWKTKYSFWKTGFKVFYGPVKKNPKLMIISYNPGGGEYYFQKEDLQRFEKGNFSAPKTNSYLIRKNKMAKKMQDLFEGFESILATSVTFPILFFRSESIKIWKKSIPKSERLEIENFCILKVKEIFENVKPEKLLIVGFGTDKKLKKHFFEDFTKNKPLNGSKNRKLAYQYTWNRLPIFCLMHPTGNRISNSDWKKIKQKFNIFLRK